MTETMWKLPFPSSGTDSPKFQKLLRRECMLLIADEDARAVKLLFDGVEAFRCTYHHACTLEMIKAYDKVIDRGETEWLNSIKLRLAEYNDSTTELRHLMIYFDDGPCYEFICRSFRVEGVEL